MQLIIARSLYGTHAGAATQNIMGCEILPLPTMFAAAANPPFLTALVSNRLFDPKSSK